VSRLVERARGIRIGYELDPQTQMGPVVSDKQQKSVERYIEIGKKEGAKLACGGERAAVPGFEKGFYLTPTIFTDVDNKMAIAREEIFCPVLSVLPYKNVEQATETANDNDYGLACGVWGKNIDRAQAVARELRAGTAWI